MNPVTLARAGASVLSPLPPASQGMPYEATRGRADDQDMTTIATPTRRRARTLGVLRAPRWTALASYVWFVVAWVALIPSLLPFMLAAAVLNGIITLGLALSVSAARFGLQIADRPARARASDEALRVAGLLWRFGGAIFLVLNVVVRL